MITPEVISAHNLTEEEFARIQQLLGREPSLVELGIFSVMWSEHCSYKSSRIHLQRLPTKGERVIVPPGENAGVVDVGDGWCAAFKIESHNHPSFIEPFQGAATGVGGILRDIFTMGARPIAALNSLRFGSLNDPKNGRRNRSLLAGVVAGIAHYGNAFGVPTIGGEVSFNDAYALNPLVNAFALGLVRKDQIFFGKATGVGNPVLYVGAKTGRDGIHGATMASAEFDEEALEKRPTVQVGDPFLEKLLLEACLDAMRSGAVAGIQDMGAAGLTCSTCEMAARADTGIEIDLSLVPQRETQNSQVSDYNAALIKLLSSPNLASKEWVYRQYDHMVRTNTVVLPGADAAVVRIKETRRALAVALDGNGRYCAIDPREGAKLIVAEAARNVVCVGAQPIAITNCLNFASPERPEVMWSFSEVIDGMTEACKAFNTPVVSGNVSFYNETEGRGILPTPVIGMLGLIDDVRRIVQPGFKNPGDFIALLGTTGEDLAASEYMSVIGGNPSVSEGAETKLIDGALPDGRVSDKRVPKLNLETELAVQRACLRAAQKGLLRSAHDCSDGGLAVALAECCFSSLKHEACGADIDITGEYTLATRLFSESPSRIVISFDEAVLGDIEEIVAAAACSMTLL